MKDNTVRIAGYKSHSFVNGPGSRFVLFMQGCPHHCEDCQNPETWDMHAGQEYSTDDIIKLIQATQHITGVTFSGGDPIAQPEALATLVQAIKKAGLNIWIYTGWTYDDLTDLEQFVPAIKTVLDTADVLVDGRFVNGLKSENCLYRGSTNQRLIDLPATRNANKIILYKSEARS